MNVDEIGVCVSVISLIVAFVSLYRTRKSEEQQHQIDQGKVELDRQSNQIRAIQTEIAKDQLALNQRVIAQQSPAVVKVEIIEKSGKYFLQFQNTGLGEAFDVYFEVIDSPTRSIHEPKDHTDGISFPSLPRGAIESWPLLIQEPRLLRAQLNWSNPNGDDVKKTVDVTMRR